MTVRAAVIQMNSQDDKAANVAAAERLVTEAAARGAGLVVLPEYFAFLGRGDGHRAAAEPVPGPLAARLGALAQRLGIDLVAGTFLETDPAGGRPFNTSLVFARDGRLVARYRKLHLFDVEAGGRVWRESDLIAAGDAVALAALDGLTVGLSVCYDVRFPELYRRLADAGARAVTVPSAFTRATGLVHWEVLLRARAIENQVFVLAAAQCGESPPGSRWFGHAMIVDPWGTVLARADGDGEGLVLAELDLAEADRVRARLPALAHRRRDVLG